MVSAAPGHVVAMVTAHNASAAAHDRRPCTRRHIVRSFGAPAGRITSPNPPLPNLIGWQSGLQERVWKALLPSAFRLLRRHQCVVALFGAHASRPGAQPLPVLGKCWPFFDGAEHHAETELRADIEIGGAETIANQVIAARDCGFERIQDGFDAAVTDHALALRRHHKAKCLVAHRRLYRPRREEQPAIIRPAQPVAGRRRELRLRKGIGQVGADRRRLGDDDVAIAQRRHLAHRIDGEIGRRLSWWSRNRVLRRDKARRFPPASSVRRARATSGWYKARDRRPWLDPPMRLQWTGGGSYTAIKAPDPCRNTLSDSAPCAPAGAL